MPWKEVTEMELKQAFIKEADLAGCNMSELCRRYGISRKTGYKYLNRYRASSNAPCSLVCKSRRPHHHPFTIPDEMISLILATRDTHHRWGGVKIRQYLRNKGDKNVPTEKTINRILKRYGRICEEESLKHKACIRFEREKPNDLWQMDFKGDFATATARCYPLTLLDDHSRFSLLIRSCANQRHDTVKQALTDVFRQHGLPIQMTMDNGAPWGFTGKQLHTRLTAWLIRLGIYVSHSRPYHPQTQGKLERFHRTLKEELLSIYTFDDLAHAQSGFDYWRDIYNYERPHGAIDLDVPHQRYQKSERGFPETLPSINYEKGALVRKVNPKGLISLDGKRYRVGEAFQGQPIALEQTDENNMLAVRFCHQKVIKIDLEHEAN